MASANAIGVIPNEPRPERLRRSSVNVDRMDERRLGHIGAIKRFDDSSSVTMPLGRKLAGKSSPASSDCDGGDSILERQIESTARLFYIGHALLLPGGRFWRPRTNHDLHPECPHSGRAGALYTGNGLVPDLASAWPRPRSLQSLGQSATTASELEHPCPRPSNVRRHGTSPPSPHPRTLRGQSASVPRAFPGGELAGAAAYPRPHRGIVISMTSPRSRHQIHQTKSTYVPI